MKALHGNIILCGLLCLCATVSARAQETNAARTLDELRSQITAHIEQPRFNAALWGIKVVSLDSGKTLFESHADRLMSPASNTKLYAAALALDRLGPDYRIVTPVLATDKPDADGTLHGNLVIAGRGDSSWNQRRGLTNFWQIFSPFVAIVTNAGVRHITGDVIGDATFFRSPPTGSSWTVDDLEDSEGAEISALTLNDNYAQIRVVPGAAVGDQCIVQILDPGAGLVPDNQTFTSGAGASGHVDVRRFRGEGVVHILGSLPVGSQWLTNEMPVLRPAEWFAVTLLEALREHGVTVDGAPRSVTWPTPAPFAGVKLGEVTSPPLRELVRDFLKPSQNLETDLIFEHTGETARTATTPVWETSEECAVDALNQFLATNNLPAGEVFFDEGSGLSRNNLATANATVALLQFMAKHRAADDFIAALPVAGVDGTLRNRMKNPPAFQNVRAKTGTLRWVNALSGFVTTAAGEHLVFSLMLNRYEPPPNRKRTDELDDIAIMLAQFAGRPDTAPH